jgi:pimeloyl-ACP methyl ester carboxylesterase/ketosteroid isomerase-like protein
MKFIFLSFIFFTTQSCGQQTEQSPDMLYEKFAKGYDELNAQTIANLYTNEAELLNLYDKENPNSVKGKDDIKKYFQNFFQPYKAVNKQVQITFKITDRKKIDATVLDNGFYRIEIVTPSKPSFFYFGKFSTILEFNDSGWKFRTDASNNTDFEEYENAIYKTIPEREELLYPQFYDELLGDYVTEQNQLIVIGRSQIKLFAYFENTNEYRGLNKVSATTWTVGKTIKSNEIKQTFKFNSDKIEIYENEKLMAKAIKKLFYKNEKVTYANSKGIKLGGTIFIPVKPNGKAIVLTHGSGPQDRNGYASIIRLLADIFARDGVTVLTYDKQGVGQSEGNNEKENFAELAQDALAGISFLRTRKNLSSSKIGLGGSSQAGWIIAKAIEQNKDVDFALTIGSAGSGISVVEQNIYNTEILMQCSGVFSPSQITNAITQQRYFFEYLANQSNAKKLDGFTKSIEKDTLIRDWLFPVSNQIDLTNRNQWFTALEINFNPLPVWKNYNKPVLMLFSEFDDSTPATDVKSKVDNLKNKNIQTILFTKAQHIGIETASVCKSDIADLTKFNNDFFAKMKVWLKAL